MNGMNGWFRQFAAKVTAGLRSFMCGRYGTDRLNMVILTAGLVVCLVSAFIKAPMVNLLLTAISYALMIWAISRSFSRQTYKRYQENRKFLQFFDRLKDRDHRYFDCPNCGKKHDFDYPKCPFCKYEY